jgi:hypothetical protein
MRIDQNNLVRFGLVDRAGVAQPEHVFRELTAVLLTATTLSHKERLKSFFTQSLDDFDSRDVRILIRARVVRLFCEYAWRVFLHHFVGQRLVTLIAGGILLHQSGHVQNLLSVRVVLVRRWQRPYIFDCTQLRSSRQ